MDSLTLNGPGETKAVVDNEAAKGKVAVSKSRHIGLCLGIVPGAALILTLSLLLWMFVYRTQGGQIQREGEITAALSLLALLAGVALLYFYLRAERYRRMLRSIELNLDVISAKADSQETLDYLEPFPVGERMPDAGYGWNKLIGAVDELRSRVEIAEIGDGMSQFLCSYDAQRLLGLLDSLPDGIVLTDNSGNIILANRVCEGMIGRRLSEFIGRSVTELFVEPHAKAVIGELLQRGSLLVDNYFEVRFSVQSKGATTDKLGTCDSSDFSGATAQEQESFADGDTVLQVRCHRQKEDAENGGLLVLMRDITQQKVRDAGRESFIAHVSHELRSPLTNIRAYAETLLSDMMLDTQSQKEAFNVINEETSRLIRLVNDVLDLSSMETGSLNLDKGEVVLDRLVRQCVNDVKAMASSKKITLQANYHPKLPNLNADREKLSVVINNILSNAIKYTPVGGTVFVETNVDDRFVYVKVADTGYGISVEEINKIFDKFYRVEREETLDVEGTGLGLSISKEIVAMHGGTINVTSELNKGTEILVKLPLIVTGPVLGPAANKDRG